MATGVAKEGSETSPEAQAAGQPSGHVPAMPKEVARVFGQVPKEARMVLMELRRQVFAVADHDPDIGTIRETLKWGEPAYLTERPKTGATLRLGMSKKNPGCCGLYFNCQSSLAEEVAALVAGAAILEGTRGVVFPVASSGESQPDPDLTALLIRKVLRYHLDKSPSNWMRRRTDPGKHPGK